MVNDLGDSRGKVENQGLDEQLARQGTRRAKSPSELLPGALPRTPWGAIPQAPVQSLTPHLYPR